MLSLEERLEGWRKGYAAAYRRQRAREHRALLGVLDDAGFRRGLALASPVLAEAAERARRSGPEIAAGRRESRLDAGLVRYVSRAALKLSPFSTLTRVALGTIDEEAPEPLVLVEGWRERSLLRVQRYLIEQDVELICRHRAVREGLKVALSPTLEEVAPERYRFLRPERWVADAAAGKLRHEPAALAEVNLSRSLMGGALEALREGPRVYRELAGALAAELGGAAGATAVLDKLVEAGVLLLITPWPGNEPHLEVRLLDHLRSLPAEAGLAPAIAALDRLTGLERGFPEAADPVGSVREIDRALDDLWRAAAPLAGIGPGIERWRNRPGDVCEDVLLTPALPGEDGVLRISGREVREIARSAEPWARLTAFQGHRLDLLHTLGALLERRWPGRGEVGFLELFAAAQPLWKEYRKLASSGADLWSSAFNPFGLQEVAALAGLRTEIWTSLRETLRGLPPDEPLPPGTLERLAARIPERWASPLGPCLFVQPASPAGGLWVLNRIFEGTGRYGSRFTAAMSEETRRRYTAGYLRAARREGDGGPAELLDLMWSRRDTLNVHAVQTARVLAIPGEELDPEAAEPVSLRDLRVSRDGATGLPRLTDAGGRRLLPVHLGGTASALMPFLVQLLALWGPGEIRPPRSPVPARREGDLLVLDRLTSGCLVLARRRWVVSLGEELRRQVAAASGEAAFAALNRWRLEKQLPESLFWIEKTPYPLKGDVYKPQYLGFSSPLLVEVFRAALRDNGDPLTFEEMLPTAGDLPRGPGGERWAVELQVDTLALAPGEVPEGRAGRPGPGLIPIPTAAGGRSI
ncbi:MAG TPA: lantibiotic dehydratase [Thermoanaerobaculia bacterium]